MTTTPYRFGTHADVPDLVSQLTRLSNLAFAEYEGAMPIDEEFMAWYLQRPGSRPELCPVALDQDSLVCNVLVALQGLQLGGQVLPCGIIDTVATAPAHRRRGLARRLMHASHDLMRRAGAEAAVLYTNPDGHPYGFYQSLGYETRATGAALMGRRPEAQCPVSMVRAGTHEHQAVRALLDSHYALYEGYAPMTDKLWRWHRTHRPASMPIELLVTHDASGLVTGTAAYAEVELLLKGSRVKTSVISDWASSMAQPGFMQAALARAANEQIMALVDADSPACDMLTALGFCQAVREVAMVLPFTDRAREAMASKSGPWYIMIESVVGV